MIVHITTVLSIPGCALGYSVALEIFENKKKAILSLGNIFNLPLPSCV
jgi:hypothetical protein